MSRRFVLLDRDGTINREVGHLSFPGQVELIAGSLDALRELSSLGLGLIVVTNQADVGRGTLAPERLDEIHARLAELLAGGGVELDGIYSCPHRPDDGCGCRKPEPGLAFRAAADHGFELASAFVVGDHASDVGLGRRIGATTILVRTGHGSEEAANGAAAAADHVASDLKGAAAIISDIVTEDLARR